MVPLNIRYAIDTKLFYLYLFKKYKFRLVLYTFTVLLLLKKRLSCRFFFMLSQYFATISYCYILLYSTRILIYSQYFFFFYIQARYKIIDKRYLFLTRSHYYYYYCYTRRKSREYARYISINYYLQNTIRTSESINHSVNNIINVPIYIILRYARFCV